MTVVEGRRDLRQRRVVDRTRRNRHHELEGLPGIARVDRALEAPLLGGDAGAVEHRGAPLLERLEGGLQGRGIGGAVQRLHVVAPQVGADEPERRKGAGIGGQITSAMPSSSASAAACSGPAPPKAASTKSRGSWPRRVETIFRTSAMAWLTTSMTGGGGAQIDAERLGEAPAHGGDRGRVIDGKVAVEQRALVEVAEQEVAVGDRGLAAAAPVAHRAGLGAGALGADPQRAARSTQAIEPPPADTSARSITGTRIGWPVPFIQRVMLDPPPTS